MSAVTDSEGTPAGPSNGIAVCVGDRDTRLAVERALAAGSWPILAVEANVETLVASCGGVTPSGVILGARKPDRAVAGAVTRIRAELGRVPVVAICTRAGAGDIDRALRGGVDGVVLARELEQVLLPVLSAVCAGQTCVPSRNRSEVAVPVLTTREKQMLAFVAIGLTNAEIAARLYLAESTVKSHLSSAFGKLNVSSRHEAATLILDPERGSGLGVSVNTAPGRGPEAAANPDPRIVSAA